MTNLYVSIINEIAENLDHYPQISSPILLKNYLVGFSNGYENAGAEFYWEFTSLQWLNIKFPEYIIHGHDLFGISCIEAPSDKEALRVFFKLFNELVKHETEISKNLVKLSGEEKLLKFSNSSKLNLIQMLNLIEKRPTMYLSERSFAFLWAYISGYRLATKRFSISNPIDFEFESFCDWVRETRAGQQRACYSHLSFERLIMVLDHFCDHKAFHSFFELFGEWKEHARTHNDVEKEN